jgi:sulfur dioxygenase
VIFRQLFDKESSTYTYLLADPKTLEALIIDPVFEQADRDLNRLRELGLSLRYILETHVHADHVTGAGKLSAATGAKVVVAASAGTDGADVLVKDGDIIRCGSLEVKVLATPGHTDGCLSYWVGDRVFTGDGLMIRTAGRTDFQQGSPERLFDSITNKLYALPDTTWVYPGHDYAGNAVSTIGEEKKFNARISTKQTREGFVNLMNALNLPSPKKLQEAVPANLKCGRNYGDSRG